MKILAVIVVMVIIMYTLIGTMKRSTYKKLVTYLQKGEIEQFNNEIDSRKIKLLFPKISILDMKLNASILEQDKLQTISYLEQICSLPLTNSQKEIYYMKAFNFFIGIKDKSNSRRFLEKINLLPNEQIKLEANRVYNIYIKKNDKDLSALLEELEDMEDEQKGVHEFLISLIYKNKKDFENAEKYEKLSKEHFALIDERTAQKYQQ